MRRLLAFAGFVVGLVIVTGSIAPSTRVLAAQRYTQPAQQCVHRQDLPAGTNNVPNPFSRFYNTCNLTITLMITTDGYGNNGPGSPMPGAFMVMGWTDGVPKSTHTFACVYPGEPVKPGSTFVNPPSYEDTSYECLVP